MRDDYSKLFHDVMNQILKACDANTNDSFFSWQVRVQAASTALAATRLRDALEALTQKDAAWDAVRANKDYGILRGEAESMLRKQIDAVIKSEREDGREEDLLAAAPSISETLLRFPDAKKKQLSPDAKDFYCYAPTESWIYVLTGNAEKFIKRRKRK